MGVLFALSMLIWSLTIPMISWAAVLIAALTFLAATLVLVRAFSVSAIADSEGIRFQGIVFRREFAWTEVDKFSISLRVQGRALFVDLKSGSQYLVPSMLQYKQVGGLEELRGMFETIRRNALSGA
ncbi:hypothetical protein BH10ACT2_BH10ACT2_12900 [soil metagenome]